MARAAEWNEGLVEVERAGEAARFAICTLVTGRDEYAAMRRSFEEHGFGVRDTEFLWVDQTGGNRMDAFEAYNAFLLASRAPYVILCHQDVVLMEDGRARLDTLLAELEGVDPHWGICGNAGVREDGVLAIRISDPHAEDRNGGGPFPVRVESLDENFLLVRRAANLALSRDLAGFHTYGVDLCLVADLLGWTAWVIDFHLRHLSGGSFDEGYDRAKHALRAKYGRAYRARWVQLPSMQPVFLTGMKLQYAAVRVLRRMGFWPRLNNPTVKEPNAPQVKP